ncbi:hypothetical protein ACJX0J_012143 [Zea mays]
MVVSVLGWVLIIINKAQGQTMSYIRIYLPNLINIMYNEFHYHFMLSFPTLNVIKKINSLKIIRHRLNALFDIICAYWIDRITCAQNQRQALIFFFFSFHERKTHDTRTMARKHNYYPIIGCESILKIFAITINKAQGQTMNLKVLISTTIENINESVGTPTQINIMYNEHNYYSIIGCESIKNDALFDMICAYWIDRITDGILHDINLYVLALVTRLWTQATSL